jgi:hypothetical protein
VSFGPPEGITILAQPERRREKRRREKGEKRKEKAGNGERKEEGKRKVIVKGAEIIKVIIISLLKLRGKHTLFLFTSSYQLFLNPF